MPRQVCSKTSTILRNVKRKFLEGEEPGSLPGRCLNGLSFTRLSLQDLRLLLRLPEAPAASATFLKPGFLKLKSVASEPPGGQVRHGLPGTLLTQQAWHGVYQILRWYRGCQSGDHTLRTTDAGLGIIQTNFIFFTVSVAVSTAGAVSYTSADWGKMPRDGNSPAVQQALACERGLQRWGARAHYHPQSSPAQGRACSAPDGNEWPR